MTFVAIMTNDILNQVDLIRNNRYMIIKNKPIQWENG